jgi:hypothetical protein
MEVSLLLRRAPLFLRVVRDSRTLGWDALDQLADVPQPDEQLFIYRRVSDVGRIHVDRARRHGGSIWAAVATYEYVKDADVDARDTRKWQTWCWRQKLGLKRLTAAEDAKP